VKAFIRIFAAALLLLCIVSTLPLLAQTQTISDDPYIWLEERDGDKALEWVRAHDDATVNEFKSDSHFAEFRSEALAILDAKDRIPYVTVMGSYLYNFWQDADHVRGIWRRTTLAEYNKPDPQWETVLDIDSLNRIEGQSWVYKGANVLPPAYARALIYLSPGGQDAVCVREFDLNAKSFVSGGFSLPEAKSSIAWYDENTVVVGTDFGPGSLTSSGYPRIAKLWKRGTPIADATTLLEGEESDVSVDGWVSFRPEGNVFRLQRGTSFWESKNWIVGDNLERVGIPLPDDAEINGFFKGYIIAMLYSDWLGVPEGSVIALKIADIKSANLVSKVEVIFKPAEKSTVTGISMTKDYLLVSILRNVRGRILYYSLSVSESNPQWKSGELDLPEYGSVGVATADDFSNMVMVTFQDYLSPTKLYLLDDPKSQPKEIKTLPALFDAGDLQITQGQAKSKDGTMIPYFLVSSKNLKLDGSNPTLLYGYGGFRSSQTPYYSGIVGKLWLERGGVYAVANIRGGGEFGPQWHRAALMENRQKAFDDFIAVGEDLVARKITSPAHLGIMGGSNGGLLMGAAFTQKPDLFNAVVCVVPLLDMIRYTKLPPGASWIGEYGDPDSAEARSHFEKYSPYQNVKTGVKYPQVLFVTSTRDDRVHPGHARKTSAKMEALGNKVYFYEETEGGHGAAADNAQRAKLYAIEYTYLWKMLGR
jgi:prolyl oligopeptidase